METLMPISLLNKLNESLKLFSETLKGYGQSYYTFDQYEKIFSDYGWYMPFDIMMKDVPKLTNQFEKNEIEKANAFLIKHFKERIKEIELNLIKSFPERSSIFKEAFNAHRKKMYFSSTILFLSQADGITENKIFMGTNFKKFSKENEDHPLVKLFKEKNSLTTHLNGENKKSAEFDSLNRHGVMHGLLNNYGSELNSLKALSFLIFVSDFRNKIK